MDDAQNYPDTQAFADLVEENAAHTEGLAQAVNASRQQYAPRPGFFGRLRSAFTNDEDPGAGAAVPRTPRPVAPSTSTGALPADYSIETQPAVSPRLNTSLMTPEQLRIRRMNLVEGAKFGRPAHERFMLFLLKFWLFLGPIAFVALTTSEVAYVLTRLVPAGDTADYVIAGGALFIDLAMMFVTFGVAIKRRDLEEKRESGGIVSKREEGEIWLGTGIWLVFALINIISQTAFLLHVIGQSHDANMTILYVFIASRVAGFILGDASTAFFLAKVDGSPLKLIARGEREKGAIYREIAQAEGERKTIEAKAEAEILLLQIKVQQEKEDAEFLAELKRQVFKDILTHRRAPNTPELSEPTKSRMRRLDQ
ncbi:hypothetical protein [Dictyobacter kobayashii]|uniref:Uncharacterized protein n=1 Tax=Dictyobacter kobayashii TaxID=2014872 RepID=A0A402AEN3_9CHLR|nr:hypothetical protein [Dictyobacter kobayashii]GCE17546.1 hypothetical protein KDK_13460 [Dictyobacter kobayashii]